MGAGLLAGLSGGLAVAAAWDLLGTLQSASARRRLGSLLSPIRVALAGHEPQISERRRLTFVSALTFMAAGHLLAGLLPALIAATLTPLAIGQALRVSRERWRTDLGHGASATARAIADALSGGHSTTAAIAEAARGGGVPGVAGRELQALACGLALGGDQDEALDRLAQRAASPSWDAIASAIALQRRAGGDLASLLRRIAEVADERERVDADARALTTQARFTARLVAGLPVAGFVIVAAVAPGACLAVVSDPISCGLMLLAAGLLAVSFALIARIARPLK